VSYTSRTLISTFNIGASQLMNMHQIIIIIIIIVIVIQYDHLKILKYFPPTQFCFICDQSISTTTYIQAISCERCDHLIKEVEPTPPTPPPLSTSLF